VETVRLIDLVDVTGVIEGQTHAGKRILGPGVMVPLEDVHFTGCRFDADPSALFIQLDEGQAVHGFIGVKQSTFEDCLFQNVGIAGTKDSLSVFKRALSYS
jgi:hypothetical protein